MAFHVACPITCRRVCDCELGFGASASRKGGGGALAAVWAGTAAALEDFLADPWLLRPAGAVDADAATVQVEVPPLEPAPEDGEDEARRAAAQRGAAAAEDLARRFESGAYGSPEAEGDEDEWDREDQGNAAVKTFSTGAHGSVLLAAVVRLVVFLFPAIIMNFYPSVKFGLFILVLVLCLNLHLDSIYHFCYMVCRRPGDPNKLMFCKRCDDPYHCYCQQPSHKNVTHGPYLCPKHTRCHSCGSGVPGSGHSTRWFLGYTCCDACGRLFVKGNYCPVCLKVYRDSEVIPMVCCDVCEKWVHIECDGISEEKYQQFQADQNLQYTCAACRGECSQIRDTEDAIRELWKRRDVADHELMITLRAAAKLPSLEDVSPLYPNSDDEKLGAYVLKSESRNTLKFSLKSNSSKPPPDTPEQEKVVFKSSGSNKKPSKKKGGQGNKTNDGHDEIFLERRHDVKSSNSRLGDQSIDGNHDMSPFKNDDNAYISSSTRSSEKNLKSPSMKAVTNNADMIPKVKIKGSKVSSLHYKDGEENTSKADTGKATKLVIHLGSRHKTRSGSPKSELSNYQREQDLGSIHGRKLDVTSQLKGSRSEVKERSVMKLVRETGVQQRNSLLGDLGTSKKHATGKRSNALISGMENGNETGTRNRPFAQKQSHSSQVDENQGTADSPDNLKPSLLKLKFKRPHYEQLNTQASQPEEPTSWVSQQEDQFNVAKGQRSKRKRPSMEKADGLDGTTPAKRHHQSTDDEVMDANWILRKLGKDAIGKRIEVHLTSDGKWHQGMVSNVMGGTLCIQLDNGRSENVELGKQAIRLIASRSKGRKR
ncbi:RING/FYVE/PHD-type zinc finger family protein [Zea mays]|uniref:RING/FYVE/PHD-type zinc finger family protein n=2 Tax=Zea mays TaxID=4577 RepID=A0A1D6IWT6_MAIZE|nr:RING/FYVE/PHD-type zinc finger family protein [Zea mays]AQK40388.1 RING/FYVE/PHD-type zinc finger family protein [Zea mays]AQK40389.1 RING/FYVE/PHD-type zinc finger family protein [Zea mays]